MANAQRIQIKSMANGTAYAPPTAGAPVTPAAGATAFVYQHGTTTQVSVFQAETGATTIGQPLTCDAGGQPPGWVAAGQDLDIVYTYQSQTAAAALLEPDIASSVPAGTLTVVSKSANYSQNANEMVVASAALTDTLPNAPPNSTTAGVIADGGAVTLAASGADTLTVYTQTGLTSYVVPQGTYARLYYLSGVWYVTGSAPLIPAPSQAVVLSAAPVLDVGVSAQLRAGRVLNAADFTTLMGLSTPVGLFSLSDLTNKGSGGALTNKGAVPFGKGITGSASEAAVFSGSTGQALYIADTGVNDPFRIKTGSWGCWFRTAKRGTTQILVAKVSAASYAYQLFINTANNLAPWVSTTGSNASTTPSSTTDVCDDRWHHAVVTYDGAALRLYLDANLETSQFDLTGPIFAGTGPLNIGAQFADGATAAAGPHFGREDEAFVTPDVLNADQVRMLYAGKVAHGLSSTPTKVTVNVRRRRKGGPYVVGDFSATPLSLWNFTGGALTDAGSLGTTLTNNAAAVSVAGADGEVGGAFQFAAGSSQYLSGTDAGLPSGTAARTLGIWFKSTSAGTYMNLLGYGTTGGTTDLNIGVGGPGPALGLGITTWTSFLVSPTTQIFQDGSWHFAVAVISPSPGDGLTYKLYCDSRLVGSVTTAVASTTLAGANALRLGAIANSANNFLTGTLDGGFITNYAMAEDEILSLFAKGAVALGASPINPGDLVEQIDATNVYVVNDVLPSQHQLDLAVST